jgi:hypothetical protein
VEALVVKAQPQATFQAMSRRNALTVASALSDDIGEQLRREQLVGWSTRKAYTDPSGTRWRHQVAASIWASAAVALEADDLGVVHQPVDPGRRVGPGFDQALERVLATTRRSLRERGRDRLARLGMAEAGQVPPALLGSTSLPDRCLG